jgi:serine acetyltransferase
MCRWDRRVVGEDSVIGDYYRFSSRTTINGSCRIGEGAFVGSGTTLIQNTSVGEWSTVGAGSIVLEDIRGSLIAFGVPAKVIKGKSKAVTETGYDGSC